MTKDDAAICAWIRSLIPPGELAEFDASCRWGARYHVLWVEAWLRTHQN